MNSEELKHYGIIGQKWGRRRYQNPDGSLTAAGRERYGTESNFEKQYPKDVEKKAKGAISSTNSMIKDAKQIDSYYSNKRETKAKAAAKQQVTKDLSEMSDKELQQVLNRLNMEERYSQIMTSRYTKVGRSKVGEILETAGNATIVAGNAFGIAMTIRALMKYRRMTS